jgi:hypothetical protein
MTAPMPPQPPITIRPAGPGQVVIAGAPRRALDLLALDRTWSPALGGWVVAEVAADVVVEWARAHGRAVEITAEVAR